MMCGVDQVGLDDEVVIEEVGGTARVSQNAAHLRCGDDHGMRAFALDVGMGRSLVAQIQCVAGGGQDFAVFRGEPPDDGRSHHAAMTGDENARSGRIEQHFSRHGSYAAPIPCAPLRGRWPSSHARDL